MVYTPVICCSNPECKRDRILAGKNFIGYLLDGQYAKCDQMLDADEGLVNRMTWDSISCNGSWGMPVWRRVGYLLQEGEANPNDAEYQRIVLKIAQISAKAAGPDLYYTCLINYCLAADEKGNGSAWEKCLRDAIAQTPVSEKEHFGDRSPQTPSMKAIWDAWGQIELEDKTCCICLDAKPDAFFSPCAHNEFCFGCARDLKTCPLCRAEGYAKQRL